MALRNPYYKAESDGKPMQKKLLPVNIAFNKKHFYKAYGNWKHRDKKYENIHKKPRAAQSLTDISLWKVKAPQRVPLKSADVKYDKTDTRDMEYCINLLEYFISFDFRNNKNHIKDVVRSK